MSKKVIRKRSSAGLGLYATDTIRRGEIVIEYTGPIISAAAADKKGGRYLFELNDKWTIDGSGRNNLARYINHSCRPNCYAELSHDERHVFIIAKRTIKPGEELHYHYGKDHFEQLIAPQGCRCQHCLSNH